MLVRSGPQRARHVQVITKLDESGHKLEPFEDAIIEVPQEHMGQVLPALLAIQLPSVGRQCLRSAVLPLPQELRVR